MLKLKRVIVTVFVATLVFSACSKDKKDPEIPNEDEVITTLRYTLTPTGGGTTVVLSFKDLDGDGGNAPIITGGTIASNKPIRARWFF